MKIKRAITYVLVVIMLVNSMNVYAAETKEYINEESIIHNEEDWDNDQAFAAYVEKTFYGNNAISLYGVSAREQLGASEKLLYDFLKEKVESVADGTCTSTKFSAESDKLEEWKNAGAKLSWNAEELGVGTIWNSTHTGISEEAKTAFNNKALGQFGLSKVIDALLHDCPYDLYWFDKTKGVNSNYGITVSGEELSLNSYFASFSVASAYKAAGANEYTTDIAKTSATVTAANNAKAIVEKYAEASDLEKLKAYRDEICALVSYNYDAISSSYTGGYGDPWQLVYVFDKDNNTNVVCEGYSKAFQYLCDMSTFTSDKICCYTVHGTMAGGTGAGKHMWNIVSMDDGKNYLVDITNSDAGSIGQNGELFLSGATGSVGEGYVINVSGDNISFTYEDDCIEMWGTDGILLLAGAKYGVSEEGGKPEASEAPIASEAPKSDEYNVLIWTTAIRRSDIFPCIDCIEKIYSELSEDYGKIVCTKQTSGTKLNPTHFTGTEVLEDIYDIIFIIMPSVELNNNDIKVLKNYVKAGGRIVLQGEFPGYASEENPILSSLAQELGTNFTITDKLVSGTNYADINLKSDLLAGKNYDNTELEFAYYSEINYVEPAEVIASYDGKAGIVDQAVEKGRITVASDFNFYDDTYRTDFVSKLFLQLLLNSSENKKIVEEGGDPNTGFGEPCALKGSVNIDGHSWTDFSDAEVSDRFYAQAQTVAVNVQDKKCGIGKVYTHISGEVVSGTAINALTDADWKELEANEGTGTFEFKSEQEGIIYAKITDAEGNVKYISTDRIIVDTIAPVIHGIENDKTYCQPVSFTVEDEHLDSVTLDGVAITADEQGKYSFEITQDEHVVVATDKAGNTTTVTLVNGHTWVYTASANVITAKCSNTGCSYGTEGVTLTIEAETPVEYTTEPYNKLNVVNDITSVTGEIAGSTLYYKANEENRPEGEALASVPSDIGKYVAAITLGGQTAYSMFEIKDTTAPVIKGINEEVYCQPVSYTVEDIDLLSVTLDGEEVLPDENGKYNMEYTPGKHEIIAKDRTGNTTSVILTMEHVWVYTASANVITAKCSNTGCSYGTEGVTLIIEAETPVEYTSESYDRLNIVNNITPVTGEIAGSTLYYKANKENEPEGEALLSVPSDIGKYVAAITLGGQTAYNMFEIKDTIPPIIHGIEEDKTYLDNVSFTVEELDLSEVTVDGIKVEADKDGKYAITITKEEHTVEAKDKSGNTTKTIVRNGKPLQCTISWDEDGDGKADSSELLDYGVIPKHNPVEMQDDFQYKYQFMGWSPDIEAVTTDKMYSAVFTKTLQEYTVSFPETRVGYDLIPQSGSKSPVTYNGSYSFYVDAKPGYDNSALVVTANGKIVIPENGLYKLTAIGCDGRDVQVNISIADTVGPTGSIQVGKDIWSVLQKNISYDKFYTTKQTVEIKGVDYGVGIQSISYCITDKEILESEFDSLSWIPYKSKFSINPNVRGIIYAKIVDNMGNETYISTCGLIFEAPDGKNDIWKNEEVTKFEKYVYKQTSDDDLKGSFYNKVRARGVKQKKKRVTLQWNTVMDADGYIIYGNQCNHGGKIYKIKKLATLKNPDITKWTNKKLKKGTYYKYTVTAYKLIDGKQKVLSVSKMVHVVTDGGKYSNPDSVKVNKKTITIKVGKSKKIKATRKLAKGKIMREHTDKFRYESTNKKVATVNKKGKIVGKSKGTCSVYVYIQNGKCATVKVKVN